MNRSRPGFWMCESSRGVFDQETLDGVEYSLDWQEQLMHRMKQVRTAAELEALCRDLFAHAQQADD